MLLLLKSQLLLLLLLKSINQIILFLPPRLILDIESSHFESIERTPGEYYISSRDHKVSVCQLIAVTSCPHVLKPQSEHLAFR